MEKIKNNEISLEARMKKFLDQLFEDVGQEERLGAIIDRLGTFKDIEGIDITDIENKLSQIDITSKDEFISKTLNAIEPVLSYISEKPLEYESLKRAEMLKLDGFEEVNNMLYYKKSVDGHVHIHIPPNNYNEPLNNIKQFREGLNRLAEVINDDDKIRIIDAKSWIVAEHPKLLERLGFTITGPIPEKERLQHFSGDNREVHHAEMERDTFLKKYFQE